MKSSDMKAYLERWQVVEAIEQQELQAATLAENWKQLNAIKQRAGRLILNGKMMMRKWRYFCYRLG